MFTVISNEICLQCVVLVLYTCVCTVEKYKCRKHSQGVGATQNSRATESKIVIIRPIRGYEEWIIQRVIVVKQGVHWRMWLLRVTCWFTWKNCYFRLNYRWYLAFQSGIEMSYRMLFRKISRRYWNEWHIFSESVHHLIMISDHSYPIYRYFDGGVSSVYFWELEGYGFAGIVLLKKVPHTCETYI